MKRFLLWTTLLLLCVSIESGAQQRCVKGIPCGNGCIAANKTCRIGTPSTTSERPEPKTVSTGTAKKDSVASESSGKTSTDTGAVKVWVNTKSRVYHCEGSRYYGQTENGKYSSEKEAVEQGHRPAYGRKCSKVQIDIH